MTSDQFLSLVKHAKECKEKNSDNAITFEQVGNKLDFDKSAEKLLLTLMLQQAKKSSVQNLKFN